MGFIDGFLDKMKLNGNYDEDEEYDLSLIHILVKKGDMMSLDDVVDILSINLIGAVPDDENIVISTNNGEPLVGSDALAGKAYMNICKRILGEEVPLLDLSGKSSFWSKLASLFKKD